MARRLPDAAAAALLGWDGIAGDRDRLRELGGHRVWKDGGWYWVLKKDYVPGERIEI